MVKKPQNPNTSEKTVGAGSKEGPTPRRIPPWIPLAAIGTALFVTLVMAWALFPNIERAQNRPSTPRPDILLITIDTLRADHCSAYGYSKPTTPTMEALAEGGVRFDVAYAPTATTAPSHATLMTSLSPLGHGVLRNGYRLQNDAITLAEWLKEREYATSAFISSFVLYHKFGLNQGFDAYDDDFTQGESTQQPSESWEGVAVPSAKTDRRAVNTIDRATEWLKLVRPALRVPIFMWVHLMDPHEPYVPPDFESLGDGNAGAAPTLEEVIRRYDGEIVYADGQLKRLIDLFDAKSASDGALIILTADHGESFTEHGWRGHGTQLYEESLRVPLIMKWRGRLPTGTTVQSPVGLQDIWPTIAGFMEEELKGESLIGRNLVPGIRTTAASAGGTTGDASALAAGDLRSDLKANEPADDEAGLNAARGTEIGPPYYFQRRLYDQPGFVAPLKLLEIGGAAFGRGIEVRGPQFGIRDGRWKWLGERDAKTGEMFDELYNLETDSGETLNVAVDHPEIVARMKELWEVWRKTHQARFDQIPRQGVSDQDRKLLETLGYVEPEPPNDRK